MPEHDELRLLPSWLLPESNATRAAPRYGDGRADPIDGLGEQTLGRREDPRRTSQARRQGQQAHGPEVYAGGSFAMRPPRVRRHGS